MAFCRVIYLPPLYLAHTPGLFEGTLVQPGPRPGHGSGHPGRCDIREAVRSNGE